MLEELPETQDVQQLLIQKKFLIHRVKCSEKEIADFQESVENLNKKLNNEKRTRKAITRQLKNVEKARKQEFDLYLDRFSRAQDIIKSLKVEIESFKQTAAVNKWKFWK